MTFKGEDSRGYDGGIVLGFGGLVSSMRNYVVFDAAFLMEGVIE